MDTFPCVMCAPVRVEFQTPREFIFCANFPKFEKLQYHVIQTSLVRDPCECFDRLVQLASVVGAPGICHGIPILLFFSFRGK